MLSQEREATSKVQICSEILSIETAISEQQYNTTQRAAYSTGADVCSSHSSAGYGKISCQCHCLYCCGGRNLWRGGGEWGGAGGGAGVKQVTLH